LFYHRDKRAIFTHNSKHLLPDAESPQQHPADLDSVQRIPRASGVAKLLLQHPDTEMHGYNQPHLMSRK
jgi:hypothetical protein